MSEALGDETARAMRTLGVALPAQQDIQLTSLTSQYVKTSSQSGLCKQICQVQLFQINLQLIGSRHWGHSDRKWSAALPRATYWTVASTQMASSRLISMSGERLMNQAWNGPGTGRLFDELLTSWLVIDY